MIMWYLLEINTHPPCSISVAGIHFAHQHYQCGFGVIGLMSGSSDLGIEFVQVVLGRKPQRSVGQCHLLTHIYR